MITQRFNLEVPLNLHRKFSQYSKIYPEKHLQAQKNTSLVTEQTQFSFMNGIS